jgi:hypothetical protein
VVKVTFSLLFGWCPCAAADVETARSAFGTLLFSFCVRLRQTLASRIFYYSSKEFSLPFSIIGKYKREIHASFRVDFYVGINCGGPVFQASLVPDVPYVGPEQGWIHE